VGATLDVDDVTSPQQSAQLAPTSEPTLAFTVEAKLFRGSSALVLLVPYRAIAPVVDRLTAVEGLDPDTDDASVDAMRRGMRRVEVEVRAEVGAIELPIERVLALAPGDVISLETPSAAGVTLWVDETPLERGRPGRSGARRAVQVLGTGEGRR
jgi:flagellar motor switch protein FliM